MGYRPALWRIPGLLRPGYPVDRIEFRSRLSRLVSCFAGVIFAAAFGGVSAFDAFQITYESSLRVIATAKPITPGTGFQGTIGEVDIERVVAVSTTAHWLAYGLEFVLKDSHTLLLPDKLLLTV
jgi:hypothetical protein